MDVWQAIAEARRGGRPMVVVTVTAARGSVPGEVGGKMLVTAEGLPAGTVGGGRIEAKAVELATSMLGASERCRTETWNLQRDVGMTCGGEMTLLFERIDGGGEWSIVVFGAGHVSRALVRLLATLACTVDVVDTRGEWLAGVPASTNVRKHLVAGFEHGVERVRPDSFVISVTQGHATDRPVLREVARRFPEVPFAGVIGSDAKKAVLWRELREDGVAEDFLNKLECPLGLPLGGNDPAEIAVSIAARLLQVRDQK
ncbi:xanthine dehydrogenase accessory protein XdhC [Haloferula sargassicola]|uniref:Xanthine dehydrogenase accessory protein XdhC n=1 Tax=Haloferula sargassicola TaxID=490096 RepID=A0ABP9UR35_9BACT